MNRLFVDNLTVIDFAFLDPKRGLVGESWIVDIELAGKLDDQGMVFDFGHVKKTIKSLIDKEVDHRLLVPGDHPGLSWAENGDRVELTWQTQQDGEIRHSSPAQAVRKVPGEHLQKDTLERVLEASLRQVLPANVSRVELRLREEAINGEYYHYVHGLKKHEGNCQRIAHGHRSKLEIWRDGERAVDLEQYWCQRWKDIYIATREDLAEQIRIGDLDYCRFRYTSDQGPFELTLPRHRVHFMDTDSTVELIANHLSEETQHIHPDSSITVRAFEGVNKGAVATCGPP